ncbi:uncharacterized protein [Anabrus simplex]|uniref:uncharacterized protein n=1 Tax=Anabrus simplex TaxID=316456 RepID=UPI0035A3BD6E
MEQLHGPIKIESVFSIENEEWPLQGDQEDSVMSASNELGHAVEDPVTVLIKREPLSGEQVDEKYTLMLESKESHHEFEDPLAIVKTEPLSNEQFQGSDKIKEEVIDSMKYFAEGAWHIRRIHSGRRTYSQLIKLKIPL